MKLRFKSESPAGQLDCFEEMFHYLWTYRDTFIFTDDCPIDIEMVHEKEAIFCSNKEKLIINLDYKDYEGVRHIVWQKIKDYYIPFVLHSRLVYPKKGVTFDDKVIYVNGITTNIPFDYYNYNFVVANRERWENI